MSLDGLYCHKAKEVTHVSGTCPATPTPGLVIHMIHARQSIHLQLDARQSQVCSSGSQTRIWDAAQGGLDRPQVNGSRWAMLASAADVH